MPKEEDIVRPKARPVALERDGNGGSNKGGSKVDPAITRNDKSFGYHGKDGNYVPWYVDMVNGGGMNASGDTFEGGPYSGVLNALGVRPMGSPASATPYARVASSGSPYGQQFASSAGNNYIGSMDAASQYPRRETFAAGYPVDNQVGISAGLMSQSQPVAAQTGYVPMRMPPVSQPVVANGASDDVVLEFANPRAMVMQQDAPQGNLAASLNSLGGSIAEFEAFKAANPQLGIIDDMNAYLRLLEERSQTDMLPRSRAMQRGQ